MADLDILKIETKIRITTGPLTVGVARALICYLDDKGWDIDENALVVETVLQSDDAVTGYVWAVEIVEDCEAEEQG